MARQRPHVFDPAPFNQALVISNRTRFSAEALAINTATADFIALSAPPRIAPPVLTAAQNSAISFL
jgi:hypothetical protein